MHFYNLGELQAMYTKNIMERKLNRPITDADNVCHDFFCYMTGTSEKSLSQPTVACRHTMFVTDKTRVQPRPREVTDGIVRWLEYIAQFYLHDPTANLVQLPFADRTAVYELYVSDWEHHLGHGDDDGDYVVVDDDNKWTAETLPFLGSGYAKPQTFRNVWSTHEDLKRIVVRKHLRFSLCASCVGFIEQRAHRLSRDEVQDLKAKEYAHAKFVRAERATYYLRRALARNQPDKYLSLIIDGADQQAFGSPHFVTRSKATENEWRIPLSLMGAIAHGYGIYGFSYLPNIRHGSNLVMEVLHRILNQMWHNNGGKKLPPILFLQLDNTAKQNKCKYLLGFLALLVHYNVFEEILVSFLLVGHTHEDIDQLFSRVAVWLRRHDARSRLEFLEAFVKAFHAKKMRWEGHTRTEANTHTENVEEAANISDFFDANDILNDMSSSKGSNGIGTFHQFKFVKDASGAVVMYVREWCSTNLNDDPWRGLKKNEFGAICDRSDPTRLVYPPHIVFRENAALEIEDIFADLPPMQRKDWDKYTRVNKQGQPYNKFFHKTRLGVEKYIQTRNIPKIHVDDLHQCLKLIESVESRYVKWNVDMYTFHSVNLSQLTHIPKAVPCIDQRTKALIERGLSNVSHLALTIGEHEKIDGEEPLLGYSSDDGGFKPPIAYYKKDAFYIMAIKEHPLWTFCQLKSEDTVLEPLSKFDFDAHASDEYTENKYHTLKCVLLKPNALPGTMKKALSCRYYLTYKNGEQGKKGWYTLPARSILFEIQMLRLNNGGGYQVLGDKSKEALTCEWKKPIYITHFEIEEQREIEHRTELKRKKATQVKLGVRKDIKRSKTTEKAEGVTDMTITKHTQAANFEDKVRPKSQEIILPAKTSDGIRLLKKAILRFIKPKYAVGGKSSLHTKLRENFADFKDYKNKLMDTYWMTDVELFFIATIYNCDITVFQLGSAKQTVTICNQKCIVGPKSTEAQNNGIILLHTNNNHYSALVPVQSTGHDGALFTSTTSKKVFRHYECEPDGNCGFEGASRVLMSQGLLHDDENYAPGNITINKLKKTKCIARTYNDIYYLGPLEDWIIGATYLLKGLDEAPSFAVLREQPELQTSTNPKGTFWVVGCDWWVLVNETKDKFIATQNNTEKIWCSSVDIKVGMQRIGQNTDEYCITMSSKKNIEDRTKQWKKRVRDK